MQGSYIASILGEHALAFDPATLLQEIDKEPRPPEWYRARAIEFASLQQKCESIVAPEYLSTLRKEIFSAIHSSSAPERKLQTILTREQNVIASVLAIHKEMLRNRKMLYEDQERANKVYLQGFPTLVDFIDIEIKRIDDLAEQLGLKLPIIQF